MGSADAVTDDLEAPEGDEVLDVGITLGHLLSGLDEVGVVIDHGAGVDAEIELALFLKVLEGLVPGLGGVEGVPDLGDAAAVEQLDGLEELARADGGVGDGALEDVGLDVEGCGLLEVAGRLAILVTPDAPSDGIGGLGGNLELVEGLLVQPSTVGVDVEQEGGVVGQGLGQQVLSGDLAAGPVGLVPAKANDPVGVRVGLVPSLTVGDALLLGADVAKHWAALTENGVLEVEVGVAESGHEELVIAVAANDGVGTGKSLNLLGGANGDDALAADRDAAGGGYLVAADAAPHGACEDDHVDTVAHCALLKFGKGEVRGEEGGTRGRDSFAPSRYLGFRPRVPGGACSL